MDSSIHSSPRLEFRPKQLRAEHAIMDANRLVHKGDYIAALKLYDRLLDERSHPAYYLNRSLCYIAVDQPHLAVNDALRAYMMAQSVIDAVRSQGEINDHIRRIDAHIITYTGRSNQDANVFSKSLQPQICLWLRLISGFSDLLAPFKSDSSLYKQKANAL